MKDIELTKKEQQTIREIGKVVEDLNRQIAKIKEEKEKHEEVLSSIAEKQFTENKFDFLQQTLYIDGEKFTFKRDLPTPSAKMLKDHRKKRFIEQETKEVNVYTKDKKDLIQLASFKDVVKYSIKK